GAAPVTGAIAVLRGDVVHAIGAGQREDYAGVVVDRDWTTRNPASLCGSGNRLRVGGVEGALSESVYRHCRAVLSVQVQMDARVGHVHVGGPARRELTHGDRRAVGCVGVHAEADDVCVERWRTTGGFLIAGIVNRLTVEGICGLQPAVRGASPAGQRIGGRPCARSGSESTTE